MPFAANTNCGAAVKCGTRATTVRVSWCFFSAASTKSSFSLRGESWKCGSVAKRSSVSRFA